MSGGRSHQPSARHVVCRLCDTAIAPDLLPLHSHYCTTAQQALLTPPPHLPPHSNDLTQPAHTRFIDRYCAGLALDLSEQCASLAEQQRWLRQADAATAGREELKAQLADEEEPDDAMLDVAARMEQVMRDTATTHSWIALQHIFHALKAICRRGFAAESPVVAGRQQLKDELLLLARLCAAAIKQKMRTVASDSRPSSPASDAPPLPRRHSASAVHSDPSTPQRGLASRGVSSPVSAPLTHTTPASISIAHPSSVPSSRSSRFNPSSRAPLSASTHSTPPVSRPASPALILSSAPSLAHANSSPADSSPTAVPPLSDSPAAQRPVADYQQLSYELGRKALLHTYMRRSSTRASSAKRATGRIGGSSTPSPPRVSHLPAQLTPPPTSERKESESERAKDEGVDGMQPSMKDFHFIRCLSVGGSSRVWLCSKRSTGDKYAVKVMRKHELLHRNNARRAMLERHILSLSSHPYIVPLYYAIPSRHHLYLVLEYMRGGDLADLLHSSPAALSRRFVGTVLAEVVLSLEYLHSLGFVHRDVKPDNIMLDGTGHVKLTDFGLSKHCLHTTNNTPATSLHADATSPPTSDHTHDSSASDSDNTTTAPSHTSRPLLPPASRHSAAGTHHYLAPETILGLPTTPAVDWWALGVLAFHLLVGRPPFASADAAAVDSLDAVMDGVVRGRVRWPVAGVGGWEERMGREGVDLVKRLLVVDLKQRLGSGGVDEIKRHAFFMGVDWDGLMQQKGDRMHHSASIEPALTEHAVAGASVAISSSTAPHSEVATDTQSSSSASDVTEKSVVVATLAPHSTSFSHVPSSRARLSASTSPSVSADGSPSESPLPAPPASQLPVNHDADILSQPQSPASPPPPSRSHLLTSLPAFTASSEFDWYGLSDTPSPASPAKLASPSLPSYLTSLAPVTTDLSLSALSSFPSLSEVSSSLLSSLALGSSSFFSSTVAPSPPVVSSANQSSLDRLLSLTRPSALAPKLTDDASVVTRPLSAHTGLEQPLSAVAEVHEREGQDEPQIEQQRPKQRSKSRDLSHAVKARRKISASAKIASRTLRSPYATNPARPLRLSPPASFRAASHRSPPAAAASVRRSRKSSFDSSSGLATLAVLGATDWSSDAENADADSELDRVSEMRKEALQARKRKDLSRTSPTVQQREQRHYARKSPAAAARRVGGSQLTDAAAFTVEPLTSDDSVTLAVTAGMEVGVSGMRAVLADVTLSQYVPTDAQSSPPTPPVHDWLLPASDEPSEWSEFCSDFSERSDRLAGSASEGGSSSERVRLSGVVSVSGESGVSSAEFASDWSVGSEDEVFEGFGWKNLATLQAKNEQVYQQQVATANTQH